MTEKEILLMYVISSGIVNLSLGYIWDGKKSFADALIKIVLIILTVFAVYILFKF